MILSLSFNHATDHHQIEYPVPFGPLFKRLRFQPDALLAVSATATLGPLGKSQFVDGRDTRYFGPNVGIVLIINEGYRSISVNFIRYVVPRPRTPKVLQWCNFGNYFRSGFRNGFIAPRIVSGRVNHHRGPSCPFTVSEGGDNPYQIVRHHYGLCVT